MSQMVAIDRVLRSDGEVSLRRVSRAGHGSALLMVVAAIAVIEFVTVTGTAYLASVIYNLSFLQRWPPIEEYLPAALFLAAATLLMALTFRHFAAFQTQPKHRFLWNGIVAVTVAFSF